MNSGYGHRRSLKAKSLSAPLRPWQRAHFNAYAWAPSLAVPLPEGSSFPSGPIAISHAFTGLAGTAIALLGRWLFLQYLDPDSRLRLVNFAAAWWPFVFSVLVAFIPDMRKAHWGWRTSVVAAGFMYSILLWHQQGIQMEASRSELSQAVETAVDRSNEHSDKSMSELRSGMTELMDKMSDEIGSTISGSTSSLAESLGRMPSVDTKAELKSTFMPFSGLLQKSQFPIEEITLSRNDDGSITVPFSIMNISPNNAAEQVELWIEICSKCTFISDPDRFRRLEGMSANMRYRRLGTINAGLTMERMTAAIEVPQNTRRFAVRFRHSCTNCGTLIIEEPFYVVIN
jgi:hypothetical protein